MPDQTAPAATAAPTFLPTGLKRVAVVTLDFPVAFAGREFHEIHIKRMTAAEVAAFVSSLDTSPEARVRWPIFVDADGARIPTDVLDNLDDDDSLRLDEVARDFLPRRFRGTESKGSDPAAGDTTARS